MQQKLFHSQLNDTFNCNPKLVPHKCLKRWSWIPLPHPESCHIYIFSQMAKNFQSLPNLFYTLFVTKLNEEGLLYCNCLPAMNDNSPSSSDFSLASQERKCSTTLAQQPTWLNFEIMKLLHSSKVLAKLYYGAKLHYIIMMITTCTLTLAT